LTDVISAVPRDQIPNIWPRCAELLKPSLDFSKGRQNVETQYDRLISGSDMMWVMTDDDHKEIVAAITFNIMDYPTGLRLLQLMMIGGTGFPKWGDELDRKLTQFGKETGCKGIEHCGRMGWKRATKKFGYELEYANFYKGV